MPKQTPESAVEAFLKNPPPQEGKCATCRLKNVSELNRAMVRFHKARESRETTQTWESFRRHVLVPALKYPAHFHTTTLRRHMKDCLGL